MIAVEICCNSRVSAKAAKNGGAKRIELCRELDCGGLTPTDEDIDYCVRELGLRTHVLVRPRAGDFCYNVAEVAEIERSIVRCRELGTAAVVIGFLDAEGRIDASLTRRMVELAKGMEVTFHRAFDEARQDPLEALQVIADSGCTRLLTSGQAPTASEGAEVIKRLVEASDRVTVLAASGVTPWNVRQLIEKTGVREVHGSCKIALPDGSIQTDIGQVREILENTKGL